MYLGFLLPDSQSVTGFSDGPQKTPKRNRCDYPGKFTPQRLPPNLLSLRSYVFLGGVLGVL